MSTAPVEPRDPASLGQEIVCAEQRDVISTRTDPERLRLIEQELRTGFETLGPIGPAVCIFGSVSYTHLTLPTNREV